MKYTNLLKYSLLTCAIVSSSISMAMNCSNATKSWEKEVCASKELLALDHQLNNEYKKCLQNPSGQSLILGRVSYLKTPEAMNAKLKADQKAWSDNISNIQDAVSLKQIYYDRLDQLKLCTGDLKLIYTIKPGEISKDKKTPSYVWKVVKLSNKTIIEYPQLIGKPGELIGPINHQIETEAQGLLLTSLSKTGNGSANGRFGVSYGNYWYSVDASKPNKFGIEINDNSEGCLGGCTYVGANAQSLYAKASWDLVAGKEIKKEYS